MVSLSQKGTILDPFLQQKQCPFLWGHHFQPFCGKGCPKGTVLENVALLVGGTLPKGNCFGSFLLKRAPFFKAVPKMHCFGSVFFSQCAVKQSARVSLPANCRYINSPTPTVLCLIWLLQLQETNTREIVFSHFCYIKLVTCRNFTPTPPIWHTIHVSRGFSLFSNKGTILIYRSKEKRRN